MESSTEGAGGAGGPDPGGSGRRRRIAFVAAAAVAAILAALAVRELLVRPRERFRRRFDAKASGLVAELRRRTLGVGGSLPKSLDAQIQNGMIAAAGEELRELFRSTPRAVLDDVRAAAPGAYEAWARELREVAGRHRAAVLAEAGRLGRSEDPRDAVRTVGGRVCLPVSPGKTCWFLDELTPAPEELDRWLEAARGRAAAP